MSSNLNAEVVTKIIVNGNKRISEETIKVYGGIELNKDLTENDLNQILNDLYSTDFFEDIDINLQNQTLTINLKEHPVINQLVIAGEEKKRYTDKIKELISLKEKKSFIKPYLSKDIDLIKSFYSSLGYNFAKVEAKVKKINNENLDLLIEINRGEQTKISTIKFLGNENIRSKRLKDLIASEEDKFWKFISKNTNLSNNLIELDKRLLINYYKSIGYYDIKVSSNIAQINKEGGNADLIYILEEGTRYTINKISTNVDNVFDKNIFFPLREVFTDYVGDYYSPFKIKKLLEKVDQLIEDNNLQFVEHNVQEEIIGDSINIIFNIYEGKKNLVERINITGNNITNEEVIRGELVLDEGDPYVNLSLEKSIAKIRARNIFKNVSYKVNDGSKNNLKIIDINVEEKPTGEISAGAGVGTSGGTIAFNISENNWLGEGKQVEFEVELTEETLLGIVSYNDPNYDFLGNSLNYSISNRKNDKPDQGYENSVISGSIGTSFEQYTDVKLRLGLDASYDDLKTESSASESLKKQAGTFSELAARYGLIYDKRDRVFMPTDGSIISFSQLIPLYADKNYIGNNFNLSKYKNFGNDIIGAGKIFISTVNGLGDDDVRLSKRKYLSDTRLRGFERNKVGPVDGNDHIGGNYAAAVNIEANLPNLLPEDSNTDLGIFLDFGNVWGVDYDSTLDESNKIRSSTGLAASWSSPLGPMTFVLSKNLTKADTDKTESFSFNLGTTF
tara:strand:+ start:7063 stop:9258 length:2196 start_codon:yes stop_codon:yes gene_type:complete